MYRVEINFLNGRVVQQSQATNNPGFWIRAKNYCGNLFSSSPSPPVAEEAPQDLPPQQNQPKRKAKQRNNPTYSPSFPEPYKSPKQPSVSKKISRKVVIGGSSLVALIGGIALYFKQQSKSQIKNIYNPANPFVQDVSPLNNSQAANA